MSKPIDQNQPPSDDHRGQPNHWFALLLVLGIPVAVVMAVLVWWFTEFSQPGAP